MLKSENFEKFKINLTRKWWSNLLAEFKRKKKQLATSNDARKSRQNTGYKRWE